MAKSKKQPTDKTKNGSTVCVEAQKMSDIFICHYGIEQAERIAVLILEKIRAKLKSLKGKP